MFNFDNKFCLKMKNGFFVFIVKYKALLMKF